MKKILIVTIFLLIPFISSADTIYLKNGQTIEGEIIDESEKVVVIKKHLIGGEAQATYLKKDITKIKREEVKPLQEQPIVNDVAFNKKDLHGESVDKQIAEKMIYYVSGTKYRYRNMEATYLELSTTYAFTYLNPKFIGWKTERDPDNPVAVLVIMEFSISGVPADILNAPESSVSATVKHKMNEAVPILRIIWRVNDLMGLKITPYNWYAEDSITVYKDIVNGMHKLAE